MKHTNGKLQMRFLITFYFDVRHFLLVVIQLKWPVLISVISSHKRNSKRVALNRCIGCIQLYTTVYSCNAK